MSQQCIQTFDILGQPMPAAGGGPTPPAVSMPGQEAASAAAGRIQMINQVFCLFTTKA